MKIIKKESAITLIALVITIVVLIILAAVAINMSLGNNGLFNRAKTAKEQYVNEQDNEYKQTGSASNSIDNYVGGNRDTIFNGTFPDYTTKAKVLTTEGKGSSDFVTTDTSSWIATADGYVTINTCVRNNSYIDFYIDDNWLGKCGVKGVSDAIWDAYIYPIKKGSTLKIVCGAWSGTYRTNYQAYFMPIETN